MEVSHWYEWGIHVTDFLYYFPGGVMFAWYCRRFLQSRLRGRGAVWIFILVYVGAVYALRSLFPTEYQTSRTIIQMAVSLLLLFVIVRSFFRGGKYTVLFLTVSFLAVREASFYFALIFLTNAAHLFPLYADAFGKGYLTIEVFEAWTQVTMVLLQLLTDLVQAIVMFFALRSIIRSFREKEREIKKEELQFVLMPSVLALMLCVLMRLLFISRLEADYEVPYDRYPLLQLLVPVILAMSLWFVVYGVRLYENMELANRERMGRILMERQVEAMEHHVREMEYVYAGLRRMKHDMKNLMAVAQQLSPGEIEQELESYSMEFQTGNSVADALLIVKYHQAAAQMPELEFDMERLLFPPELSISGYDLCIILSNALDNAIEANLDCTGERFIRARSFVRAGMLFLKVENPYDGALRQPGENGLPRTKKSDAASHGMGLENIRQTAEKNLGSMDWSVQGQIFTLTVMLKLAASVRGERLEPAARR